MLHQSILQTSSRQEEMSIKAEEGFLLQPSKAQTIKKSNSVTKIFLGKFSIKKDTMQMKS